jgi:hypothetical protein
LNAADTIKISSKSTLWDLLSECFGRIAFTDLSMVKSVCKHIAIDWNRPFGRAEWRMSTEWPCTHEEEVRCAFVAIGVVFYSVLEELETIELVENSYLLVSNLQSNDRSLYFIHGVSSLPDGKRLAVDEDAKFYDFMFDPVTEKIQWAELSQEECEELFGANNQDDDPIDLLCGVFSGINCSSFGAGLSLPANLLFADMSEIFWELWMTL